MSKATTPGHTPPPLPATTHRCHDPECGAAWRCARHQQRHATSVGTPHAHTLKHGSIPHHLACDRLIRGAAEPGSLIERGPAGWTLLGFLGGFTPGPVFLGLIRNLNRGRHA